MKKVQNKSTIIKHHKVKEVQELIDTSKSIYLFDYHGINAVVFNTIKMQNVDKGLTFKIFKNTLAKIAMDNLKYNEAYKILSGPTAFAFIDKDSENELLPGKVLMKVSKEIKTVKIKGAIIENTFVSGEKICELANYEKKTDIIGAVASTLSFPLNRLLITLQAIIEKQSKENNE